MDESGQVAVQKRRAGEWAADQVSDGDVVGLGTGSTAAYAIEAIGEAVEAGLDVRGIPTSYQSRALALDASVPITDLDAVSGVDVSIDGADQVADGVLIKGGGAAHAREEIVDAAADRFLVVVDERKPVDVLDQAVPVEVLPPARPTVMDAIEGLGGGSTLRSAGRKDGPVVTEHGNLIVDADFGTIDDPHGLAESLEAIPGVVAHGLFVGLADEIVIGGPDGVRVESVR